MADDGFVLLSLASVPPLVVSGCDEGALEPAGVTIGSLSMADIGGHLIIESSGMNTDIGGHLMVEASGIARSSNDPVFFTHGAQCGAQATVVIELGEGETPYDSFRNRLEHGPGLHDSIANYVDNGDGTMTVVHTYPGLTCDLIMPTVAVNDHVSFFSRGLHNNGAMEACDDEVVETLSLADVASAGFDSSDVDCVWTSQGGDAEAEVSKMSETADSRECVVVTLGPIGEVSERDAVVAGAVGGTTFTMSALYAHWRHAKAARLRGL